MQLMNAGNKQTMKSYDLWVKLNEFRAQNQGSKIQHGDFLSRVEDECDDLGVSDFFLHPQNNQPVRFYELNKDQMLLVGMRESKVVRKKVLEWLKNIGEFQIPQTYGDALQLCADQAKQLEIAAPKVAFVDNCVSRLTLMTASQVGQKHGMSAVKLNRLLDEVGGVYNQSVKRGRVFCQSFIDKGYGELKQTEQGYSQALFTTLGEQWINSKLIDEGAI